MSDILYDVRLQGSMLVNGAQTSYFQIELPKVFDMLEQHVRIQIEQEFANQIMYQTSEIDRLKSELAAQQLRADDATIRLDWIRRRNLIQRIRNK